MLTGWRSKLSKCFLIQQRYVLVIMLFFAIVNAYTMRVSLNLAITEMVPISNETDLDENACPSQAITNETTGVNQHSKKLYDWNQETQGIILSSFYWGYLITHLPGGLLSERFGGKYALGIGILSTTIFTLLTPLIIVKSNGNWAILVALRVIEGLGEGTTYPAISSLLAHWIPSDERARMGSVVYAGGQIGTVVCNLISGWLIQATDDWASVFYLFGTLGAVWCFFFFILCYSEPNEHPFISDQEREMLAKHLEGISAKQQPTPWRAIMTSVPLWALVAAQVGHDWGFYTMVTDLPTYMKDVLKFRIGQNGTWNSVPYIVMWIVSIGSGWLCDWLTTKGIMTVTFSRKFFTSIASLGPAIFMMAASYSGCDSMLAVSMFTISMGFMGTFYCGMKVNSQDLSPNFAGTLMAIVNGIGAIAGIVSPYVVGAMTGNHTLEEWRVIFWISFGIFMLTNIIYILFASGEEQWWNDVENHESSKNEITDGIKMES